MALQCTKVLGWSNSTSRCDWNATAPSISINYMYAADRTLHVTIHDRWLFFCCCCTACLEQTTWNTSESVVTSSFQTTFKNLLFLTLVFLWNFHFLLSSALEMAIAAYCISCPKYIHTYILCDLSIHYLVSLHPHSALVLLICQSACYLVIWAAYPVLYVCV